MKVGALSSNLEAALEGAIEGMTLSWALSLEAKSKHGECKGSCYRKLKPQNYKGSVVEALSNYDLIA